MELTHYIVLAEKNHNEGETWYFFMPYDKYTYEFLESICDECSDEDTCEFDVMEMHAHNNTLLELDKLIHTNYMDCINFTDEIDLEKLRSKYDELKERDELYDLLYKGSIQDFQKIDEE